MLVLSRKADQRIVIGDDPKIVLTIVKLDRNQVRIGIDAPPSVPVYREELVKGAGDEVDVPAAAGHA